MKSPNPPEGQKEKIQRSIQKGTGDHSRRMISRALMASTFGGWGTFPLYYSIKGGRGASVNPLLTGFPAVFRCEIKVFIRGATLAFFDLEQVYNGLEECHNRLFFGFLRVAYLNFEGHSAPPRFPQVG